MNVTVSEEGNDGVVKTEEDPGTEPKLVEIEVNGKKVQMPEEPATGMDIKNAAIQQGVGITTKFVLQQEMPNGTGRVIGDNDKVDIRDHLSFTAIAPDDNS